MFAPLGALGAFGGGAVEGYTRDSPLIFQQMGLAALGRAFQPQQGPIDQLSARGPQPPMPGQASMPAPRMEELNQPAANLNDRFGSYQSAQSPAGLPAWQPEQPASPAPPAGRTGAPPPTSQQPPGMAQGGGGLPFEAIAARIQAANPGLPPRAMISALVQAIPLMNADARARLTDIRRQAYGLSSGLRQQTQSRLQQREDRLSGKGGTAAAPEAATPASHEAVNPTTGQVIFFDQARNAWVDKDTGQLLQAEGSAAPTP